MIGWHARRSWWPLAVIATLGSALTVQACSGKVQDGSGCGSGASCGGAVGASGGKGEGGSAAVSSGAGDSQGGASVATDPCENNIKDGNEADVDCGGPSKCARCADNSRCNKNNDCESAFCQHNRCAEPSCSDRVMNQDETGVDCGGSCLPCDVGLPCLIDGDCSGGACVDRLCVDHCSDGLKNIDETDIDCGGPTCAPCADAKGCTAAADCESSRCVQGKCQVATCSDQVMNQDETDVDCGGTCIETGKGCQTGARCVTNADCGSYICSATSGKCLADVVIAPADVIDDFEDGDLLLPTPARSGRVGTWYAFNDGSGTGRIAVAAIKRGAASVDGFRVTGMDFTSWGSGFAVDLNNSGNDLTTKVAYDASAYSAITFWARAETSMSVTVVLPDGDTDKAGGVCTVCDHHYYEKLSLTTNWQRYTVSFSDLELEPGGVPTAVAFKPSAIFSLMFRFSSGLNYDAYFDDVGFIEK